MPFSTRFLATDFADFADWKSRLGARGSAAKQSTASIRERSTASVSERRGASPGRNILVDPEQIRRIVLLLDRREERELVRRKRRAHPVRRLALADVVEIDAPRRERPRRGRRRPRPRNVSLGVRGVGPTGDDHEI